MNHQALGQKTRFSSCFDSDFYYDCILVSTRTWSEIFDAATLRNVRFALCCRRPLSKTGPNFHQPHHVSPRRWESNGLMPPPPATFLLIGRASVLTGYRSTSQ